MLTIPFVVRPPPGTRVPCVTRRPEPARVLFHAAIASSVTRRTTPWRCRPRPLEAWRGAPSGYGASAFSEATRSLATVAETLGSRPSGSDATTCADARSVARATATRACRPCADRVTGTRFSECLLAWLSGRLVARIRDADASAASCVARRRRRPPGPAGLTAAGLPSAPRRSPPSRRPRAGPPRGRAFAPPCVAAEAFAEEA